MRRSIVRSRRRGGSMAQGKRHALITGSSRGIGRGIALALAADSVKIAIHYYRNESAARDTLAQVRKRGADGVLVQADVTDPAQIDRKSTRLNSSHTVISYAVFCLK